MEPTSSEHDSSTTPLEEISRKKEMAELRKLELEVEALERGRNWEGRIARFIPIITAVISIGGYHIRRRNFYFSAGKRTRSERARQKESNNQRLSHRLRTAPVIFV